MNKLLFLILIKAIVLIAEAAYFIANPNVQYYNKENLVLTSSCEFVNWTVTQLIIWSVALRFYGSTIPVRRLELTMLEQRELVKA